MSEKLDPCPLHSFVSNSDVEIEKSVSRATSVF